MRKQLTCEMHTETEQNQQHYFWKYSDELYQEIY